MDYKTAEHRAMVKYKYQLFCRELKRHQKQEEVYWQNLEMRKEKWKPKYDDLDKLVQDYLVGKLTDKEYYREKSAYWQVYSDHHRGAKMRWLQENIDRLKPIYDYYENRDKQKKLDYIHEWQHRVYKEERRRRMAAKYNRESRERKRIREGRKKRPKPRKRVNRCSTVQPPSNPSATEKEDT